MSKAKKAAHLHLDEKALGLAAGLIWAVAIFLLAVVAQNYGYGSQWVDLIATVYKGYGASLPGALAGLPWAFIDAFLGGFLLAWLYNKLAH